MTISGMKCTTYVIGDVAYPICIYLEKNWKTWSMADVNKTRFDPSINSSRVVIENPFACVKNRCQILKHFNSRVSRTA